MDYQSRKLLTQEREIIGNNFLYKGKVVRDDHHERIIFLINEKLEFIKKDESGWCSLYFDKNDGRFWEKYYPNSDQQGGGAPALRVVSKDRLVSQYQIKE